MGEVRWRCWAELLDLEMLTMTPGGRKRPQSEFQTPLAVAGLALVQVVLTASALRVLKAHPVYDGTLALISGSCRLTRRSSGLAKQTALCGRR